MSERSILLNYVAVINDFINRSSDDEINQLYVASIVYRDDPCFYDTVDLLEEICDEIKKIKSPRGEKGCFNCSRFGVCIDLKGVSICERWKPNNEWVKVNE